MNEKFAARNFEKKAVPLYITKAIFLLSLVIFIFLVLQVVFLIINIQSYKKLKAGDSLSVNYLQRVPLLNELLLYSLVSVIQNDHLFQTQTRNNFDSLVFASVFVLIYGTTIILVPVNII